MSAPLRVLFVASEVAPFRKTGGLADVAGSLPKALKRLGVDVRVVMPLYSGLPWLDLEALEGRLCVSMYTGTAHAGVRLGKLPGSNVPVYFIEHNRFFDRPFLYGPPGDAYSDNLERFTFFAKASLELSKALGFQPDVIHAHDWQSALVPVYLNTVEWGSPLHACASVFTIHNLAYQGVFGPGAMFITGLGHEHLNSEELEHFGDLNLLKGAVVHSTMVTTVSPTYCQEIQTGALGCGLDGVLASRSERLRGILNGIDTDEWNPMTDRHIARAFALGDWKGKVENKLALQRELQLPIDPDVPMFGIVGRLTGQKGFDVLAHGLHPLLNGNAQVVLLGTGDADAEHFFGTLSHRAPDRFRSYIGFDSGLAHRIEAASDFFIMPSRFEPCGLNQMYSQRYGTLPIVRRTGGLADTVTNYDQETGRGTGFVFEDLTPDALAGTFEWVLDTYRNRPAHIEAMRRQAMGLDWSWERAAMQYVELYEEAFERRRGHPRPR